MGSAPPLVAGKLLIPAAVPTFKDGTAHISLDDASYSDKASKAVVEIALSGVDHGQSGRDTTVAFTLSAPGVRLDPKASYVVQAWIDCDGDGRLGKGDLYCDVAHPVLTRGHGARVKLKLRRV